MSLRPKIVATVSTRGSICMEAAEKGAHYARIFRKAGILLGKGRVGRAVIVLEEGRVFAERLGDRGIANRFKLEVERASRPTESMDN